ncbi:MAG: cyclase family protein [Dehalococcoidia bacterium]|nr:MAG: cyclase family protein [Dehalococcoidia bacterium]
MDKNISTKFSGNDWIDISLSLNNGMVQWPGDPPVRIERVQDLDKGDSHTLSRLTLGSHSGTHVDAPSHFLKGAPTISDLPPEVLLGTARVIEIEDRESIKPEELARHNLLNGERVLFKTYNSALWQQNNEFKEDFIYVTSEAANHIAERGVSVVGVDYLSVGGYKKDGSHVHRILLEAGIWIIEGINLSHVEPGIYQLVCLPLKITGGDGAPARAVLRKIKPHDEHTGNLSVD